MGQCGCERNSAGAGGRFGEMVMAGAMHSYLVFHIIRVLCVCARACFESERDRKANFLKFDADVIKKCQFT